MRACRMLVWMEICLSAATVSGVRAQDAGLDVVGLFRKGEYEAARQACLRRLDADPDAPQALYYLGRLSDEGAVARRHFERLIEAHPDHALADSARLEMAELAFAGPFGLYLQARSRYLALLSRHPDGPHAALALCRVGQTYLAVDNADSARTYFERSLAQDPESDVAAVARVGLVQADLQAGDGRAAAARLAALQADGDGAVFQELSRQVGRADGGRAGAPTPPETPTVWIQVGAFSVAGNASALVARLGTLGIDAEAVAAPGRGLHLVFAGPFPDRASAEATLARIRQETGIKGYIVNRQ